MLGLGGGLLLLLLLLLFGPGRHDSVHARVGDGLASARAPEVGAATAVEGVCPASLSWAWVTAQIPRESVASDRQQMDILRIEEISCLLWDCQEEVLGSTELSINRVE
jgi:hypothetical protein